MTQADFVTIDGLRVYYESVGDGSPLILLHGGQTDSRMWDGQIQDLAKYCRVIRYDQRGYGQSEISSDSYRSYDDLLILLDALQIDRVHLLGHSGGGALALDFALAYPERVLSLILFSSGIGGYDWSNMEDYSAQMGACFDRGDAEGMAEVSLHTWTDGPNRTPAQVDKIVRERIRLLTTELFARFINDGTPNEQQLEPPAIEHLGKIQVPALVIIGQDDATELHKIANLLANEITDVRKTVLPTGAHMVNMEIPAAFNQAVLDFLSSNL